MRMQGAFSGRARVSGDASEATENDSRKPRASQGLSRLVPTVGTLRLILTAAGVLGAAVLIASAFTNIIEIKVLTTAELAKPPEDLAQTGWDRHSVAPLVLGGFAVVMILGAVLRAARPAIFSIAAIGIAALAIGIFSDARHIHDTGQVGELYEDAQADPATGFYLETLGGALLLICGGGLLVLSGAGAARQDEDEDAPEPAGTEPDGWFA
jgi:hypothetical protein